MSEPPTVAQIQQAVCERFGIRRIEMQSNRRQRVLARPRQIAMYLAYELTPRSFPEIGRLFGGRDHTTVLYACRTIARMATEDSQFATTLAELRSSLLPQDDPNQMALPLAAQDPA